MKLIVLTICVSACCALFFYEAVTVSLTTRKSHSNLFWTIRVFSAILTLEEMKQLEDEEARMHLKCFILLLWSFAVYTLITFVIR